MTAKLHFSPFSIVKDRSTLEKDLADYLAAGGQITLVIDKRTPRSAKLAIVGRALHYAIRHRFYSFRTGIALERIKELSRNNELITDEELEKLWCYVETVKVLK